MFDVGCWTFRSPNTERPTRKCLRRFMGPMRANGGVGASHEPENRLVDFQTLAIFRFMFTEQFKKEQGASHEPPPRDEHRTPNIEHRTSKGACASSLAFGVRRSVFGVRCSFSWALSRSKRNRWLSMNPVGTRSTASQYSPRAKRLLQTVRSKSQSPRISRITVLGRRTRPGEVTDAVERVPARASVRFLPPVFPLCVRPAFALISGS